MKANCVNVLNKTVNNVCLLDNIVKENTQDIEFLFKYMDFNKNLQLANLGCCVNICTCIFSYCLQPCFIKDQLLQFFLVGILDYLNSLNKENYFFIAKNSDDIPELWRNHCFNYPCVVQIGLIECDKFILPRIIDATKAQNFSDIIPVLHYLQSTYCNLPQYTLAFLQFLTKMPDINLDKSYKQTLCKSDICKGYEELQEEKLKTHKLLCCFIKEYKWHYNVQGILDAVLFYIKKATEALAFEYKQKSFNDPFYPTPTQHDVFKTARNLFLENNNLIINDCGYLVHNSEPFEPNEPNEPYEPSEPSNSIYPIQTYRQINNDTTTTDQSKLDSETLVEMKIKKLLELTDTETEASQV